VADGIEVRATLDLLPRTRSSV